MSYPLNYPTPQNANVQIFYGGSGEDAKDWVKPQGASFVWFTLIGAGGGGDTVTAGGGSGAVSNFMCPAFLIPDELSIQIGAGGKNGAAGGTTAIYYRSKAAYGPLLSASGGAGGASSSGGAAVAANYFTAMGFYQSIAGQNGSGSSISPSNTTFLSGGAWDTNSVTANYGYSVSGTNGFGYFMFQPIIVGVGGVNYGGVPRSGGIGCGGGGGSTATNGGDGVCVIITW